MSADAAEATDGTDPAVEATGDEAGEGGGEEGEEDDEKQREHAEGLQKQEADKGKEEYQKGNYEEAVKSWSRSLMSVRYILDKGMYANNEEQLQEVYRMELRLNLNMAQALLKMKDWYQVVDYSNKVLAKDPNNPKALYRKASALLGKAEFTEARKVAEHLLTCETPPNPEAKKLLANISRDEQVHSRKAKKVSQRMLAGMDRDPRVPPTTREWAMEFALWLPVEAARTVRGIPQTLRQLVADFRTRVRRKLKRGLHRVRVTLEALTPRACRKRRPPAAAEAAMEDDDSGREKED